MSGKSNNSVASRSFAMGLPPKTVSSSVWGAGRFDRPHEAQRHFSLQQEQKCNFFRHPIHICNGLLLKTSFSGGARGRNPIKSLHLSETDRFVSISQQAVRTRPHASPAVSYRPSWRAESAMNPCVDWLSRAPTSPCGSSPCGPSCWIHTPRPKLGID